MLLHYGQSLFHMTHNTKQCKFYPQYPFFFSSFFFNFLSFQHWNHTHVTLKLKSPWKSCTCLVKMRVTLSSVIFCSLSILACCRASSIDNCPLFTLFRMSSCISLLNWKHKNVKRWRLYLCLVDFLSLFTHISKVIPISKQAFCVWFISSYFKKVTILKDHRKINYLISLQRAVTLSP